MAHDRIIGLYEETAAAWDEARRGGPTEHERPHLQRFADALTRGASVLDIGSGSGVPIARDLIAAGFEVTGVDSSAAMIGLCRSRFPDQRWLVADMRRLDLARRFDGILAWYSFFHLCADDQRAMFPIFAAHAAPAALLTFTSGPRAGVSMGEWQGEPLFHESLSQEEYRQLLAENGFSVISFTAGEPLARGPSVWLARFPD